MQGVLFRPGDKRFEGKTRRGAVKAALADPTCLMVNRNAGAGTRVLIDKLLGGARPPGYANQPRSHNAVAAAVAQARADWGVAIEPVARLYGLGFLPLCAGGLRFPAGGEPARAAGGAGVPRGAARPPNQGPDPGVGNAAGR